MPSILKSQQNKDSDAMKITISNNGVFIDGKAFRILSGEMHYFRIHPDSWKERLEMLKACGLNTVSTYMPWNLHERIKGKFNFKGQLDIHRYMKLASELGLKVILRPGPYICSEWDLGGFPAWLLSEKGLRLRCSEPRYLGHVKNYFQAVFHEVKDFYGKNLILMQIENGYASYGNDLAYYDFLKRLVDESGFKGIVITADGDSDTRISAQIPKGVWSTMMCGRESPIPELELRKQIQPDLPQMLMEYWNGQGMHTGRTLRLRDAGMIAENLDKALAWGAHVNLYMFHGGTNFGFMNGSMRSLCGWYDQLITSYDTCAPLSECGDATELYLKTRDVLAKYNPDFDAATPIPSAPKKAAYGDVPLTEIAPLAENMDALSVNPQKSVCPMTMEEAGGDFGYVRYSTTLIPQSFPLPVSLYKFQDRGWAFFNGKLVATFGRDRAEFTVNAQQGGQLDIVVENMGRSCFFCNIEDNCKGISGGVILNNQQFQHGWLSAPMPMENLAAVKYSPVERSGEPIKKEFLPAFFRGSFTVEEPKDTFALVPCGTKGFCRINGTLLGRYDKSGPIYTLYVPAGLLKKGENVFEVFEYETLEKPVIRLLDRPVIAGLPA
jgi:beta-galactosidase